MKCKMCKEEKSLIKAHIIPACFFKKVSKGERIPPRLFTNRKDLYSKQLPIGIYDKKLLCQECENKYTKLWDDYACKVLVKQTDKWEKFYDESGKFRVYQIKSVDYDKLKLFFMSVLWRITASEMPEFSKIRRNIFINKLEQMVKARNPGDENMFSVVITKFDHFIAERVMIDPCNVKLDGYNFINIYFSGINAFIKTDSRVLPKAGGLYFLALRKNYPLFILVEDFLKSKELSAMKNILKASSHIDASK